LFVFGEIGVGLARRVSMIVGHCGSLFYGVTLRKLSQ
jgi:hypothetical protein